MTNAERRAFLKQLAKTREDFLNWPHEMADEAWQCMARFPTPAPGFKFVPAEPTQPMVTAGEQFMGDGMEYLVPEIYRAMVAESSSSNAGVREGGNG